MRIFSSTHTYPHPFHHTTLAHWNKYPNPATAHVIHVDVLSRSVDPATGVLRTERLITCRQSIPALVRRLFGADEVSYAYEVSETDAQGKVFVSRGVNVTWADFVRVEETCRYTAVEAAAASAAAGGVRDCAVAAASPDEPSPFASATPPSPALDGEVTVFSQEAKISVTGVNISRIANAVEELSVARFHENAVRGRAGLESVLERLRREGEELVTKVTL